MGEWTTIRLGDVATVRSGFAFKSKDWADHGVPVVKIANVKGGNLDMTSCSYVPAAVADKANEFLLADGDVVIALTGYIGEVALVRTLNLPVVLNQRVGRFLVRDESILDPRFLFYVLFSPDTKAAIKGLGYGSAQPNVSPSLIHGVTIPLPPLAEQRAIAEVLGALDDKIEANQRSREAAGALASMLLEAQIIAAIEAGTLVIEPLRNVAAVNLRSTKPSSGSIQYLDISSVGDGEPGSPEVIRWSDAPSRARRCITNGDTLWSTVRPNRRSHCLVLDPPEDLVVSTGFAVLTPITIGPSLLYGLSERSEFVDFLVSVADGSAYPAVRAERFYDAPLPLPPDAARLEYEATTMPLRQLAENARREAVVLAQLRDALLPKLMSGELRVRDAENLVEDAV